MKNFNNKFDCFYSKIRRCLTADPLSVILINMRHGKTSSTQIAVAVITLMHATCTAHLIIFVSATSKYSLSLPR